MKPLVRAVTAAVLAGATLVAALLMTSPASAARDVDGTAHRDLAGVRAATAKFHDVSAAEAAGYVLLDVCFDDSTGGMGLHYLKGIDATLDPHAPEALVYEVTSSGPKLVAVEYIVPTALSSTAPAVLGQTLHENPTLPLWVLHAWIWKPNPSGMFEDYNPTVASCPEEA